VGSSRWCCCDQSGQGGGRVVRGEEVSEDSLVTLSKQHRWGHRGGGAAGRQAAREEGGEGGLRAVRARGPCLTDFVPSVCGSRLSGGTWGWWLTRNGSVMNS